MPNCLAVWRATAREAIRNFLRSIKKPVTLISEPGSKLVGLVQRALPTFLSGFSLCPLCLSLYGHEALTTVWNVAHNVLTHPWQQLKTPFLLLIVISVKISGRGIATQAVQHITGSVTTGVCAPVHPSAITKETSPHLQHQPLKETSHLSQLWHIQRFHPEAQHSPEILRLAIPWQTFRATSVNDTKLKIQLW